MLYSMTSQHIAVPALSLLSIHTSCTVSPGHTCFMYIVFLQFDAIPWQFSNLGLSVFVSGPANAAK